MPLVNPDAVLREALTPRVLFAVLAAQAVGYLLQIFSPLRLNNDAVRYLALAKSYVDGDGFTIGGSESYLPLGYPRLVAALATANADSPAALIGINLVFLVVGLAALDRILIWNFHFSLTRRMLVHTGTLGSVLIVNYSTLPQAEVYFFALAMVSLMLMSARSASYTRRLILLAVATALAAVAIDVRTIGVALIPGLVFSGSEILAGRDIGDIRSGRRIGLILPGLAAAGIAMILFAHASGYWYYMDVWHFDAAWLSNHVWRQLAVFAQTVLNLPNRIAGTNGHPALAVIAIALVIVFLRAFWRRAWRLAPVDVMAMSYAVIVFVWPDYQARFWMPLVPIMLAYAIDAAGTPDRRIARLGIAGFALAYLSLGTAGLVYSIWLSFSGLAFADRYGSPEIRPAYRAAFSGAPTRFDDANEHLIYEMLVHYEPLARIVPPQPPK